MARVLVTGGTGSSAPIVCSSCWRRGMKRALRFVTWRAKARCAPCCARAAPAKWASASRCSAADLNADAGWAEAAAGCDYVLHVASPFPSTVPKDENELIAPARDGALRVLRAARDAGVKRVVLTSSFAAIGYGAKGRTTAFTEADWTNLEDPSVQPYQKSKTIAERAAWDFIAREGGGLELAVVNPVGVFGSRAGARLFDFDPVRETSAGRLRAGMPRSLVRRRRCAGRRRSAPQGDDRPGRTGRTVSRHQRRFRQCSPGRPNA